MGSSVERISFCRDACLEFMLLHGLRKEYVKEKKHFFVGMCGIFGRYSWRKCADAFFGRDTLRFVCSSGMDKISLAETRRKCTDVSRC
ncbi:MAG: hypothetical protein K5766_04930 [Alphaproteobacteria bacterium]|nr:hypothetical protein [Alphaproteobacteria bacterium]